MPTRDQLSAVGQRYRRALLGCFGALAVVHLAALILGQEALASWTKPLPILLLAAYAAASHAPRSLLVGLLFSAGGDVALDSEGFFLIGMGLFGAAQVCYLLLFVRHRRGFRWAVLAGYLVVWCVLIALLWPGLGELQVPAAGYSLLLTASAVTAAGVGPWVGLGGMSFWISDALIATGLAGWHWLPAPDVWVMTTYFVAQFLIGSATYRRRSRALLATDQAS